MFGQFRLPPLFLFTKSHNNGTFLDNCFTSFKVRSCHTQRLERSMVEVSAWPTTPEQAGLVVKLVIISPKRKEISSFAFQNRPSFLCWFQTKKFTLQ